MRWQRQRQVTLPTSWRCTHPRIFRKTVNSTHATSGDIASKSSAFSTSGPSSFAAGQCTGRGQMRCAEVAGNFQAGVPLSFANSALAFFPQPSLPRLDDRRSSTTLAGRRFDVGGAAGVMRGWAGETKFAARQPKRLFWAGLAADRDKEHDEGMGRWSNGRGALRAAHGVDDKLVAVLPRKAELAASSHHTLQA